MTVADREFVQQKNVWRAFPNEDSISIHYKSVDHKDIPYRDYVIRAKTIISGYYLSTISVNPPKQVHLSFSNIYKGKECIKEREHSEVYSKQILGKGA